ncbi:TonB-dependent receptor [uncultured Megasphaera sp.]|uniref:TonB-dependent receptor plug domain-containing protein n=1 Tax=uncultured Megasphaera sp. TaxID=165188 RepID=UPI00260F5B01|nr:TonB-dependent receptor [uncultured Megasphaera sp.]
MAYHKIKGTKKAWITWAVLTALTVPAYAASADGAADGSAVTMKDVVVTATRTEADVKMVPNTVEVVTADDIEKLGATDVYSALRLADNVQIMNTSTGFGHRISMRGMSSDSTLILINGQRTAIEDTETTQNLLALDRINVHNIERIEIIRGAASAQYGSDALAGVINIITKKSTGKPSVTVGATTGTTNMSNYYHIDLGRQGKFSSTFDMNFSKDRQWTEHEVSGLPVKNLQGPKQSYNFSGTYELGENKNLNLDLGYYKDKLSGDWSHKEYNLGAWGGIVRLQDAKLETERRDASLSLTGKTKKDDYMVRTFYSKLDKFRFLPYTALAKEYGETNKYSIWGIEAKNSHKVNGDHTLTYGTEYDRYDVDGVNFGKDGDNGKNLNTYAAYIQDEWLLGDKWEIIPAVRYDHHSEFGSKTTPHIGVTYLANDHNRFKANWGEGYKAPSVSELYMDYTHMGVLTLGNPNLRPEESKNWDLSYEGEWGKTFGKITYFHNDIDNMISTRTVGGRHGYNEYYNIDGTTKTHGVELTLGRKLSRDLDVKVTSNWTSASNKVASAESSAHGVDGIADNITTLQLAYDDHCAYGYNATLWEQWVHDYYESDSSQTYSYNTLNFVINKKYGDAVRLFAGVDNIFNKKIDAIYLDGRIWRTGIEFKF